MSPPTSQGSPWLIVRSHGGRRGRGHPFRFWEHWQKLSALVEVFGITKLAGYQGALPGGPLLAALGTKGYLSPMSKSQMPHAVSLGLQLWLDFPLPDVSSHGREHPGNLMVPLPLSAKNSH